MTYVSELRAKLAATDGKFEVLDLPDVLASLDMIGLLGDPEAVHVNMLRGGIAKPSFVNFLHLYGGDLVEQWHRANYRMWAFQAELTVKGRKAKKVVTGAVRAADKDQASKLIEGRLKEAYPEALFCILSMHEENNGAPILVENGRTVEVPEN